MAVCGRKVVKVEVQKREQAAGQAAPGRVRGIGAPPSDEPAPGIPNRAPLSGTASCSHRSSGPSGAQARLGSTGTDPGRPGRHRPRHHAGRLGRPRAPRTSRLRAVCRSQGRRRARPPARHRGANCADRRNPRGTRRLRSAICRWCPCPLRSPAGLASPILPMPQPSLPPSIAQPPRRSRGSAAAVVTNPIAKSVLYGTGFCLSRPHGIPGRTRRAPRPRRQAGPR